jgi:uncharacterized protein (DUF2461 family)
MKELANEVWQALDGEFQSCGLISKVARIYRDVRRVHHGGPYKEHLWFVVRKPVEDWTATPVFYFEVMPEGYEYGMGYYCAKPIQMEVYRRRILREPEELERLARKLNRQKEFVLEGDEYKRSKGEVSDLLKPWFNRKNISLTCARAPDELFTSPELKDTLVNAFRWLMPYYDYFQRLELEPSPFS